MIIMLLTSCSTDDNSPLRWTRSKILSHPFQKVGTGITNTLNIDSFTKELLLRNNLDDRLELKSEPYVALTESGERSVISYRLYLEGEPLCRYQIKAARASTGAPLVIARVPDMRPEEIRLEKLDQKLINHYVKEYAFQNHDSTGTILHSENCVAIVEHAYVNVALVRWKAAGKAYESIVGANGILETKSAEFEVTGKASIFPNNVKDEERQTFELKGLKNPTYLEDKYFKVVAEDGSRIKGDNGIFDFSTGSAGFKQASVFTNASRTLEWFKSLGYKDAGSKQINFGTKQIKIILSNMNNAKYDPHGASGPEIHIGSGDGIELQNLSTDAEVVSHEFAHHVIYHSITQTDGQSVVMHEGLADYFTFARTQNACLAESICPLGSIVCVANGKCLRKGNNSMTYPSLDKIPHKAGQFISGMMWDLQTKDGLDVETPKMLLRAIDHMLADSGYRHLVITLLMVDREDYGGQYCEKILTRARKRGLKLLTDDLSCTEPLPAVELGSRPAGEVDDGYNNKGKLCAIVPGVRDQRLFMLLLLALPLALAGGRRVLLN
jgi:hypothetical protein